MKTSNKIFLLAATILMVSACGTRTKPLLPNVSGKAGEIIIVIEKENWEGAMGNAVRGLLASECQYLPQSEALFNLINVPHGSFTDLFKLHRNIVYFNIRPEVTDDKVSYVKDLWASPQSIVQVSAKTPAGACALLEESGGIILSFFEQAERDRIIRNCILYEEKPLAKEVSELFEGSPHFPMGYKLKKKTNDFVWIEDEKQYTTQGILIYRYPAQEGDNFTVEKIIARRNEIMKANVPGMFDNTWMTTSEFWTPTIEHIRYNGRYFTQTRGLWEVQNDYMGGPFVSHSFFSPDGKDIIVAEGFVYAPRYDKRQYLRQVEAIIYSWEWKVAK